MAEGAIKDGSCAAPTTMALPLCGRRYWTAAQLQAQHGSHRDLLIYPRCCFLRPSFFENPHRSRHPSIRINYSLASADLEDAVPFILQNQSYSAIAIHTATASDVLRSLASHKLELMAWPILLNVLAIFIGIVYIYQHAQRRADRLRRRRPGRRRYRLTEDHLAWVKRRTGITLPEDRLVTREECATVQFIVAQMGREIPHVRRWRRLNSQLDALFQDSRIPLFDRNRIKAELEVRSAPISLNEYN